MQEECSSVVFRGFNFSAGLSRERGSQRGLGEVFMDGLGGWLLVHTDIMGIPCHGRWAWLLCETGRREGSQSN